MAIVDREGALLAVAMLCIDDFSIPKLEGADGAVGARMPVNTELSTPEVDTTKVRVAAALEQDFAILLIGDAPI